MQCAFWPEVPSPSWYGSHQRGWQKHTHTSQLIDWSCLGANEVQFFFYLFFLSLFVQALLKSKLKLGKYQNCHLVLKVSFWFFLVLFLVLLSSFGFSFWFFSSFSVFYICSSSSVMITKIWKSESSDNCHYFVTCE